MARRRSGRGRLSTIELLPADAEPIVAWAMGELRERKRHQVEILAAFNEQLAAIGAGPISSSAFNRYAIRAAATARRLEETRQIVATITERLGPGEADDLTVVVAETIKTLIFEILEGTEGGRIDPKGAMELARALHSAASAQSVSSERRRRVERELASRTAAALDRVAKAKGLTAETIEDIKRQVLGVRT